MAQGIQVVWLSGGMHERKLTLEKIKGQFSSAETIVIDGDFTIAYLEYVVRQESCFIDDRIIIVKKMPYPKGVRQTMINQLKKLIDTIPSNVILVFDGISDEKAISTHVSKIGKVISTDDKLTLDNGVRWITNVMKELGKEIEEEDAKLLLETCGHDKLLKGIGVDVMRIACDKIATFIGNRKKKITKDDILQTAVPSQDFVIWRVFDAMDARDICECHSAFVKLCEHEQSVIGAVNVLLAISLPRFRLMLFLKESLAAGIPRADVHKQAAQFMKLQVSGKDWQMVLKKEETEETIKPAFTDFAITSALSGAYGRKPTIELYSRKDIVRIIRALYDGSTEIRARSGSEAAAKLLIDSLFLAICTNIDDNVIDKLREYYA